MEKEVDFFINLHINVGNQVQGEDLENLIEDNLGLIADWDLQFTDMGGSPIKGSIMDIQFESFEKLDVFQKLLTKRGYEL